MSFTRQKPERKEKTSWINDINNIKVSYINEHPYTGEEVFFNWVLTKKYGIEQETIQTLRKIHT